MNLVFASGFLFPQTLFGGIDYFRRLRTHFKGKHARAAKRGHSSWRTEFSGSFRTAISTSSPIRWVDWTAGS